MVGGAVYALRLRSRHVDLGIKMDHRPHTAESAQQRLAPTGASVVDRRFQGVEELTEALFALISVGVQAWK